MPPVHMFLNHVCERCKASRVLIVASDGLGDFEVMRLMRLLQNRVLRTAEEKGKTSIEALTRAITVLMNRGAGGRPAGCAARKSLVYA
jgi:hypothetical protein